MRIRGAIRTKDLLRYAIGKALQLGASYAEARFHRTVGIDLASRNGVLDQLGFVKKTGIAVRVLASGALSFASTNLVDRESVLAVTENAYRAAKLAGQFVKSHKTLAGISNLQADMVVNCSIRPEQANLTDQILMLKEIDEALAKEAISIKLPLRYQSLHSETEQKIFTSSEGSLVSSLVPRIRYMAFLTGTSQRGSIQRLYTMGETVGWETVEGWNLAEHTVNEARTMSNILDKSKTFLPGKMDLILGPEVVGGACHESCGHPQEADRVLGREATQAGESYLTPNMLGQQIGSDQVTIVDDPTIPRKYCYYQFDDEGMEATSRVLIDRGRIAGFLHDRVTAAEFQTNSNAASRSVGFDREPIVRMGNTYMKPGEYSLDELLEGVKKGVYIKTFTEWNVDDLRFNQRYVGHEAYRIHHGQIEELIRDPVLEITTPDLYGSIDAVGKAVEFQAATCGKGDPFQAAPVCHGGPHVRLRDVRLRGYL